MNRKNQGGFAVLPMLLLVIAAVAAVTLMSTSVVRPLMQSVATSRARAMTESAMSAASNQLTSAVTFTDSNTAVLAAYTSSSFAPAGGGQLPASLPAVASRDGWGNALGYCVATSPAVTDAAAAIVSAGKDGVFQTTCTAALLGQPAGDDTVRVITSATLLKGRTGAIDHGRPVVNLTSLNALQYIAPGELRPVLANEGGVPGVYLNPTGVAGAWQPVQSQGKGTSPYLNGLVSYWPMDEVSGSSVFDAMNSHDIAFATAAGTTVAPGVFGNARRISTYADWTAPEIVASGTVQVTVAMWLDQASLQNTANPMPFSFENYDIWYRKDINYIGFNTYQGEIRGAPVQPGKHFYVFVMDSRTDAGDNFAPDERIYIDGVRQTLTLQGSQPVPASRRFTTTMHIAGRASNENGWPLSNAFMDDFAIWDRALTDSEVYQLFATGRSLAELMTEQAGFVQRSGAWQPIAEAPYSMCLDYHNKGAMADGVYLINPPGSTAPFQVRCDMTRDGGGWTVFQRRYNGGMNFYLGWASYQAGFGTLNGEFWLGLDKLHLLTATPRSLRIDLGRYTGDIGYAKYTSFTVGPSSNNYTLTVSGYTGTVGDSLGPQSGYQYSTYDADHDASSANCAQQYQGAWWYSACHQSNLNGAWLNGPHTTYANGVEWYTWTGYYESLTYTEMKVR
ncbi:fibrinogen-related protein [Paraburkholderia sp. EG287A]|uniref:fibrinogen-related protein n=1 Tax=Paraburkholderia sp. EG287A TaxID=3237012 RepID=UPI0034D24B86